MAEEYTSDEGNYSSLSSLSGFSQSGCDEDVVDHKSLHSTDAEKHKLLLHVLKFPLAPDVGNNYEHTLQTNILLENELYKARQLLSDKSHQPTSVDNLYLELHQLQQNEKLLKRELNELGVNKEYRESCIVHLKDKIKEQQSEIQALLQQSFKQSFELSKYQNEITTHKSTIDWYKTQWQNNESEKANFMQEAVQLKSLLRKKKYEILGLENIITDLKMQLKTSKTKVVEKIVALPPPEVAPLVINDVKFYQIEIDSLNTEIDAIKEALAQQTLNLSLLVKEKCAILSENLTIKSELASAKSQLEVYAKESAISAKNNLQVTQQKDKELLELRSQLSKITIELNCCFKEKQQVQESINTIRSSFHKLIATQDEFKDAIRKKDKLILNLEKKMQESFMNQGWHKCAIEEHIGKELEYSKEIKHLNAEITHLKKQVQSCGDENKRLMLSLKDKEKKFEEQNERCNETDEKLKSGLMQLKQLFERYGIKTSDNFEENVNNVETFLFENTQRLNKCDCKEINEQLQERCVNLAKTNARGEELLQTLNDEMQRLKDCIHMKNVELYDKQKRYELHYRTLLRKVKDFKNESTRNSSENNDLKRQLYQSAENMNTTQLQFYQCQINFECDNAKLQTQVTTLTEKLSISDVAINEKKLEIHVLEKRLNELSEEHQALVSTHSSCARDTCEASNDVDTQTDALWRDATIEKLSIDKNNAIRLIAALTEAIKEQAESINGLQREKSFLQRLILDLQAALNSATQQLNVLTKSRKPVKFRMPSIPSTLDECEILQLLQIGDKGHQTPLVEIKDATLDLQKEMLKFQTILYEKIKF